MSPLHQRAFQVQPYNLTLATQKMNYSGDGFQSRVVQIIYGEPCIVIVEMDGSYPFITNQWPCWPQP